MLHLAQIISTSAINYWSGIHAQAFKTLKRMNLNNLSIRLKLILIYLLCTGITILSSNAPETPASAGGG
jgi:hypothetical protein